MKGVDELISGFINYINPSVTHDTSSFYHYTLSILKDSPVLHLRISFNFLVEPLTWNSLYPTEATNESRRTFSLRLPSLGFLLLRSWRRQLEVFGNNRGLTIGRGL